MTPLQLIIKREYLQDVCNRSFWIGTFVLPVLILGFSFFIGFMAKDSDTLNGFASMGQHQPDDLSMIQLFGLLSAMFLIIFLMVYGAMIFNKVKAEKTNRIMEMMASTVSGRTMMLGKVISVALTGFTQMLVWLLLIVTGMVVIITALGASDLLHFLFDPKLWTGLLLMLIYFIGGYLLFGSLYAMVGAMTDKDNENQGYITILTFMLMASFYISSYAIDNPDSALTFWSSFIPLTSPSIGAMTAISGIMPWWQVIISILILYATAWGCVILSGKIYTSAMLLNGTKFSPRDILVFLRAK